MSLPDAFRYELYHVRVEGHGEMSLSKPVLLGREIVRSYNDCFRGGGHCKLRPTTYYQEIIIKLPTSLSPLNMLYVVANSVGYDTQDYR